MRHPWMRRSMLPSMRLGCALAIVLLSAVSALFVAAPAPVLAAGDTVTLSLTNGTTFTYGGAAPKFTAVVTLGAPPTTSHTWQVKVTIAGGATLTNASPPTQSSDGLTLTVAGLQPANPVGAGTHTATAEFTNPETSATVTSAPVSFTVNKASLSLACTIAMSGQSIVGVGKPISVQMTPASGTGSLPTEARTGGTFTVKLDGPTRATYANLTANSNFVVAATAPAQNGLYTLTCIFNGSANYASASYTASQPYTISSQHALGTVQLYSNPTTLTSGQKIDFYVVFQPASGLPTPGGQFTLSFGNHRTNAFTLGSAGTFLIYFGTISSLAGVTDIQVTYMGDVNYNQATVHFPLTNQPIPPGIDDGPGANPQPTTTTTAATTETPGDEAATPTVASAAGALAPPPADSGDNLGLILIVAAALMLLIGGLGTGIVIVIYRMRQSRDQDDDAQASYGYPASGYGQIGQLGQVGRLGTYDDPGQYRPSGQYRNAGQYGRSGVYRQNGQASQAGQMGQSGLTGQTGRYRQPGQPGPTGKQRQPGQAGLTGKYRQPGQYGQTGLHRQYGGRGASPDDDTYRSGRRD